MTMFGLKDKTYIAGRAPAVPDDVLAWLRLAFQHANRLVAHRCWQVPRLHESVLDMTLVADLAGHGAGLTLSSGWTVRIIAAYDGVKRNYGMWEIADVGIALIVRTSRSVFLRKVALFSTKRLYPAGTPPDLPANHVAGHRLYALIENERVVPSPDAPTLFVFDRDSCYLTLEMRSRPYDSLARHEMEHRLPIYYLFYNPPSVPTVIDVPAAAPANATRSAPPTVGCRVVPAVAVRHAAEGLVDKTTPSYGDLCSALPGTFQGPPSLAGWPLEDFVTDQFIGGEAGYEATGLDDQQFYVIGNPRAVPISGAIVISLEMP